MSRRDGAIVAWHKVPEKGPSRKGRPVGYSVTVFRRFWGKSMRGELPLGPAASDHTVPYGTVLRRGAVPGTSWQATIGLSLRDRMCCLVASGSLEHLNQCSLRKSRKRQNPMLICGERSGERRTRRRNILPQRHRAHGVPEMNLGS